jgi:hypothetical protein
MANETIATWIEEFEAMGEEGVRQAIALGRQFGEERERIARDWLEKKKRERGEKSQAEQLAIDRAAKDAAVDSAASARRSADAAERSANTARGANVIAGIALIVSVLVAIYTALHTGGGK